MTPSSKSVSDGVCKRCGASNVELIHGKNCEMVGGRLACGKVSKHLTEGRIVSICMLRYGHICRPQQEPMNQDKCDCWPKNPSDIVCKHYIAAVAYPMNQDNQVRREKELDELLSLNGWFGKEAVKAVSPVLKAFISRVAKDSYAEGIRRAREVAAEIWLINDVDEALKKLEEEVKK